MIITINTHIMSSSNPGHEDDEEDEDARRLFSFHLPPQTPSTNFFIDSPSLLPEDLLGYTEDLSLLFPDSQYIQNSLNPYPSSVLDDSITHQEFQQYQAIEQVLIPAGKGQGQGQGQGQEQEQEQHIYSGDGEMGPSTSNSPSSSTLMMNLKKKKMDHNAKERIRRVQLNASYLALRSLLPNSQKPKDKWSAPYIIDRAVDHIGQLEGEMEKLKSNKEDMISELQRARHLKQAQDLQQQSLSVSINEITKGQLIIQVCHHKINADSFSELLCRIESQGIQVLDASEFDPCENRSCYHVRVQMDENSIGDDYVAELKDKVASWLSLY